MRCIGNRFNIMKLTFKINDSEVTQSVFYDLLDALISYCSSHSLLSGIQFSVEKTYYIDSGKLCQLIKLVSEDKFFRLLYLEKINEINDDLGL